jgi:hypothetical protein
VLGGAKKGRFKDAALIFQRGLHAVDAMDGDGIKALLAHHAAMGSFVLAHDLAFGDVVLHTRRVGWIGHRVSCSLLNVFPSELVTLDVPANLAP